MESLKFGVTLESNVADVSRRDASSLAHLETQLGTAKTALSAYQAQLSRANQLGDVAGHARYSALVAKSTAEVYQLTQGVEAATHATAGLGNEAIALGPAYAAVGAAAVGAIAAIAELGAKAIETALDVREENERLRTSFEALGYERGSGAATLEFLDRLSTQLPQSRAQLAEWTKTFQAMGVQDQGQLRRQLIATASAQAIMGDSGAAAYEKIQRRVSLAVEAHSGLKLAEKSLTALYAAGVNETDIADRMGITVQQLGASLKAGTVDAQAFGNALSDTLVAKGRDPLRAMGDELGTLKAKGLETFRHLFDDVNVEPITDALHWLIQLGDQGEPSGQAMKEGITGTLNAIARELGDAMVSAEVFFIDLETAAVRSGVTMGDVTNAIHTVGAAVREAIDFVDAFSASFQESYAWASKIGDALAPVSDFLRNPLTSLSSPLGGGVGSAPPHAQGGLVQPAPGERFASVAPGEAIVPASKLAQTVPLREVSAPQRQAVANDNGGTTLHVESLTVNVQAAGGVTNAHELSVSGLTVALERLALASGR